MLIIKSINLATIPRVIVIDQYPFGSTLLTGLFSQYTKILQLKTVPEEPIYAVSSALINLPVVGS